MYYSDAVLRMYAEVGLRPVDEWVKLGREVPSTAKPRLDARLQGLPISLYSRDQTQPRTPSKRRSDH